MATHACDCSTEETDWGRRTWQLRSCLKMRVHTHGGGGGVGEAKGVL